MRVTIGQLTEDLTPFTKQGNEVMNIGIVPRKIVEDIIEECLKKGEGCYDMGNQLKDNPEAQNRWFARSHTWENAAKIAHELLEKFEGEDDERNNNNR